MVKGNEIGFGLIHDGDELTLWEQKVLKKLVVIEGVGLRFIILKKRNIQFFKKIKDSLLKEKLSSTQIIFVTSELQTFLTDKDKKQLDTTSLDFLLYLGNEGVNSEFNKFAKHGVWQFHFGNPQESDSPWALLQSFSKGHLVTPAILYRIKYRENKREIIMKGHLPSIPYSYNKHRKHLKSAVSSWPAQMCNRLLGGDNLEIDSEIRIVERSKSHAHIHWSFVLTTIKQSFKRVIDKLFLYENWSIGIVKQPIYTFLENNTPKIEWLSLKKNSYIADPFGYLNDEGEVEILAEEVDMVGSKGYIKSFLLNKDAKITSSQAVIKQREHMSYPYLVKEAGKTYCIPETSEANEVVIYQLENKSWKKKAVLLEGVKAIDSTVIKHAGYWWLFCTISNETTKSEHSELHLYYSEDLFEGWTSHVQNPVKINIGSSRPAGTLFIHENTLYRPAQDCSISYGEQIIVNQIITLSTTSFKEQEFTRVIADQTSPYPHGIHTISAIGEWTLVDGKRSSHSFYNCIPKLSKLLKLMTVRRIEQNQQLKVVTRNIDRKEIDG
ncbi:glucosamine inositolphosphorylceramide transferase family protein [Bacillus sp. 2205SS5-2]|uniref:glucosamine inositolphosphorylceramide transferase family protein n=1 Tax=Bacillus sp. 2205SS5-2 TaxID=3109031 RepID=UPI003006DADC